MGIKQTENATEACRSLRQMGKSLSTLVHALSRGSPVDRLRTLVSVDNNLSRKMDATDEDAVPKHRHEDAASPNVACDRSIVSASAVKPSLPSVLQPVDKEEKRMGPGRRKRCREEDCSGATQLREIPPEMVSDQGDTKIRIVEHIPSTPPDKNKESQKTSRPKQDPVAFKESNFPSKSTCDSSDVSRITQDHCKENASRTDIGINRTGPIISTDGHCDSHLKPHINVTDNCVVKNSSSVGTVQLEVIDQTSTDLLSCSFTRTGSSLNGKAELCIASKSDLCVRGPIRGLPSHLLLRVFHYLPLADLLHRACLVCKEWYTLSRDSDLWRNIDLHGQVKVSDEVLARMTTYSDNVTLLDITDSRLVTSQGLYLALENCPSLQTLLLIRCHHLNEAAFKAIGKLCANLTLLNMECCYAVSDEALIQIGQGCPELEEVRLSQCCMVTSVGVSALARGCLRLQTLAVDQCTKVDDQCLPVLAEHCPQLKALSAMNCEFTDAGLSSLSKLKDIHTMELPNIQALSFRGVEGLVMACRRIIHLNLSLCRAIDDRCVRVIAQYLPRIQSLHLISCNLTDTALVTLGQHCKELTTLDVGWCKNITDNGVRLIAESDGKLTYLGLMRCDQVTMAFSEDMVARFPHITFSTMWLDCRRLLERAQREGLAVSGPAQNALASSGAS